MMLDAAPSRVLFFSRVPKIGGGETSLLAMLRGLDRNKVAPVFAALEPGPLSRGVAALGVAVDYCGPAPRGLLRITAKSVPQKLAYAVGSLPVLWRLYRILKVRRIDIAHANEALEAALLCIPCLLAGVPLVWTVRNLFAMRPLYRLLYHRSAAVMAVSAAAAAPFRPLERSRTGRGRAPKVKVVYEGIDLPPPMDQPFRATPRTAAIIGRLSPDKGQELFIRAASLVSRQSDVVEFLVAGDTHLGDPGYAGQLRALAGSLDLTEKLRFIGFTQDIWGLLARVDMVVMACPIEAFGRMTIEAMAAGRPVIGIDAGGTAEIIVPGETGTLIANDPAALAQAMLELLADPRKAVAMGRAGRQRVEERFTIKKMVTAVMEIYREIS